MTTMMGGLLLTLILGHGITTVLLVHCLIDIAKAIKDLKGKP